MAPSMHLNQLPNRNLGVDGGRFQFLMPQELLDVSNVGPALQHVRCAAVPKQVAGALLSQPCLLDPGGYHARDNIGIERLAIPRKEKGLSPRI